MHLPVNCGGDLRATLSSCVTLMAVILKAATRTPRSKFSHHLDRSQRESKAPGRTPFFPQEVQVSGPEPRQTEPAL